MAAVILTFLLFFLPLLVIPFGYAWFEPPKVIAAQALIEVLLVLKIMQAKTGILKNTPPALLAALFVLFLLTVIDLIFLRTQTTFWGNMFRLQGIFLLWHLMLFAFLSSQVRLPKIPFLIYLPALAGLFLSGYILGKNDIGRAAGTLGEPNAFAASAVFLFPFLFLQTSKKLIKAAAFLVVFWLVVISGSRAGLVALGLQVIFLILSRFISFKKAAAVCLITLTLTLTLPFIEGGGFYENRAEIWTSALAAGSLNPVLGGGFGNVEKLLPQGSQTLNNNARFQYVDSSHNFLLDYWVSAGLIGLITISFLLYKTIKNFTSAGKRLELTALLGVVTAMSFNPASVVTLIAFWFLIGRGFRKP